MSTTNIIENNIRNTSKTKNNLHSRNRSLSLQKNKMLLLSKPKMSETIVEPNLKKNNQSMTSTNTFKSSRTTSDSIFYLKY